jgi:hypothetical protein
MELLTIGVFSSALLAIAFFFYVWFQEAGIASKISFCGGGIGSPTYESGRQSTEALLSPCG